MQRAALHCRESLESPITYAKHIRLHSNNIWTLAAPKNYPYVSKFPEMVRMQPVGHSLSRNPWSLPHSQPSKWPAESTNYDTPVKIDQWRKLLQAFWVVYRLWDSCNATFEVFTSKNPMPLLLPSCTICMPCTCACNTTVIHSISNSLSSGQCRKHFSPVL